MGACRPQTPAPDKEKNSPPANACGSFSSGLHQRILACPCLRHTAQTNNAQRLHREPNSAPRLSAVSRAKRGQFLLSSVFCRSSAEPFLTCARRIARRKEQPFGLRFFPCQMNNVQYLCCGTGSGGRSYGNRGAPVIQKALPSRALPFSESVIQWR